MIIIIVSLIILLGLEKYLNHIQVKDLELKLITRSTTEYLQASAIQKNVKEEVIENEEEEYDDPMEVEDLENKL